MPLRLQANTHTYSQYNVAAVAKEKTEEACEFDEMGKKNKQTKKGNNRQGRSKQV